MDQFNYHKLFDEVKQRFSAGDNLFERVGEEFMIQASDYCEMGYWEVSLVDNTSYICPKLVEIYGYAPTDEIDFSTASSIIEPLDLMELEKEFEKCVDERSSYINIHRITTPKGERKIMRSFGRAVLKNGIPYKVAGFAQDITYERKRAELSRLLENGEFNSYSIQEQELIDVFAGSLNHYIRNQLTHIHYLIHELNKTSTDIQSEKFKNKIDRAVTAQNKILDVLNSLQDISGLPRVRYGDLYEVFTVNHHRPTEM